MTWFDIGGGDRVWIKTDEDRENKNEEENHEDDYYEHEDDYYEELMDEEIENRIENENES